MVKMHHGTLLVKRTAKEIWHGWLAPVCIKLSSSWFQKEKRGVAPAIFQAAWISPPPSPPPYTPYKLDVVFNFFEWTLVRRQSQTNNQAICGKANSSLDATLVISAAGLLEVNLLIQFLSFATGPTTNSETTNSAFSHQIFWKSIDNKYIHIVL